MNCWHKITT